MTHKPASIELYIMAYCQARLRGDPIPETEEAAKAAAQSRKVASRNTVTPATSLIKLRTTRTKGSGSGRDIQNQEEDGDGGSGDDRSAAGSVVAGVQDRITFDYNSSMSEDSASDAGSEQSM